MANIPAEIEVMSNADVITVNFEINMEAGDQMDWFLISESGDAHALSDRGDILVRSSGGYTLDRWQAIPKEFFLYPAHPNPFNPSTVVKYDLPEETFVTVNIHDILGREVAQLKNETQEPGHWSVSWNATDKHGAPVSAGVYFFHIRAGEFLKTKKMILVK